MGIIFLFVLAVAGAIGTVIGGAIGFGAGFIITGNMSLKYTMTGLIAGGMFGLFAGLIIVVRALQDYWKSQDRHRN